MPSSSGLYIYPIQYFVPNTYWTRVSTPHKPRIKHALRLLFIHANWDLQMRGMGPRLRVRAPARAGAVAPHGGGVVRGEREPALEQAGRRAGVVGMRIGRHSGGIKGGRGIECDCGCISARRADRERQQQEEEQRE